MSRANVSSTGIWTRREIPADEAAGARLRSALIGGSSATVAPAAAPRNLPAPLGDLSRASIPELQAAACSLLPRSGLQLEKRRRCIRKVTEHLSTFDGLTWQERWDASGYDTSEERLASLNPPASTKSWTMTSGLTWLVGMRVIVPSVLTLRRDVVCDFAMIFRECQKDPLLEEVVNRIRSATNPDLQKHRALTELSYVLASQGIPVSDLTPGALIHFDHELRKVSQGRETYERQIGALIWEVLHTMGRFPEGTPATIRMARQGGPRSVEEFVDKYGVKDAGMRQLLIDYINQRAALGMDHSSLRGLTANLVRNFWCVVERVSPGQHNLDLNEETYEAWRQEVDTINTPEGPKPRQGIWDLLIAVRALYLDLQTWATEDPARWGPWATRCPIPPIASRGYSVGRRRQAERIADRTRARQPLLDHLIRHVSAEKERLGSFRAAGTASQGEAGFDFDGVHYTHIRRTTRPRAPMKGPRARRGVEFEEPPEPERQLRVRGPAGETINISAEEDRAFWTWAAVEVLRLTGIRHEELLELSHLSIRQYRRPNGEVVGLLVVAPSKSDRERVIPMSPELLHVIAELIRRHTTNLGLIPLVRRWDPHEREHGEPLPHLFQYTAGPLRGVFSTSRIAKLLHMACAAAAKDRPEFEGLSFTPHDFRRIFATDLVNNGLPIHIGAALLGHANLQTTRGYVAVFDEDVVRHYQMHIASRRALRPDHEYAQVSNDEWEEFEEHFDKRKVELGACGRPYGTPCAHEHACIRCPMLHVEPRMILRLDELEADLLARRERAEKEGWKGEVDGLELTLGHLRDKRGRVMRLQR